MNPYIVVDPNICHGKPTFRGTRIFVSDVLEMIAEGRDWDAIVWECHGSITRAAIGEAVRLAGQILAAHEHEYLAQLLHIDEGTKALNCPGSKQGSSVL
jgi:uncharacterized protein (DUF433 family)